MGLKTLSIFTMKTLKMWNLFIYCSNSSKGPASFSSLFHNKDGLVLFPASFSANIEASQARAQTKSQNNNY